ncbi:MAG: CPBP family intramembrane metalloprotease [Clostridia bacterium]|nr:CPBP family intramembrane metalloprotease [Clostridia bacterium]
MDKQLAKIRCKNCGSKNIDIKDEYAVCRQCKAKFIIKSSLKDEKIEEKTEEKTGFDDKNLKQNIYSEKVLIDPKTKKIMSYNKRDSALVYIFALLLPVILGFVLSIILFNTQKDESGNFAIRSQPWFSVFTRVLSALLLFGLFFFYNKKHNISFRACGITKKASYLYIPIAIILGVSVVYLTDSFITMIAFGMGKIGVNVDVSIGLPLTNFWWFLLTILLIGFLPAVTEELIYRGMIFNGLKKMGKWPAILLSALAFCLMHGSLPQFPYTFLLGIILGYVMWETGALWLCMLIHFCNNATVLVAMFISSQKGVTNTMPTSISTEYVLLAIGLMILAVGITFLAFFLMKKIKAKDKNNSENDNLVKKTSDEQNELFSKTKKDPALLDGAQRQKEERKTNILLICGFVLAILFTIITL